jgi:hypothetical protein
MNQRLSRRAWIVALASLGLVCGGGGPAWAWGARGHRVATRIAEARLTPEARAAVRALLHEGDDLVNVCNWADHEGHTAVPGSARWHFVNVPLDAPRYTDRDCPGGGCVVAKIRHFRKVLADRRAPRAERARALLFLVHLVEDVHQPLHVGDNRDRGGNDTQVQFLGSGSNLHRVWDTQIIDGASRDDRKWVESLQPLLTPANVSAWSKGDVETWANESLAAARQAYRFPKGSEGPVPPGARLGAEYAETALPVIRLRLAQAGVRLANELNTIFR